ncbi:unnamed protein product [Prunus armeniaca]
MCRTRPEPLKGGPGTRQLSKGCAGHARSTSRGTLALANFLREKHHTGCAEYARNPPRGTLSLINLQRRSAIKTEADYLTVHRSICKLKVESNN